jgi:hypothetical protein
MMSRNIILVYDIMVCTYQIIIIMIMVIIIKLHLVESQDKHKHKIDIRDCEKCVKFRKFHSGTFFSWELGKIPTLLNFCGETPLLGPLELRQSIVMNRCSTCVQFSRKGWGQVQANSTFVMGRRPGHWYCLHMCFRNYWKFIWNIVNRLNIKLLARKLRIYWISSRGRAKRGAPPA